MKSINSSLLTHKFWEILKQPIPKGFNNEPRDMSLNELQTAINHLDISDIISVIGCSNIICEDCSYWSSANSKCSIQFTPDQEQQLIDYVNQYFEEKTA